MSLPQALRVALTACLVTLLGLIATPASAAPSTLDVTVETNANNGTVVVNGTLTDDRDRAIRRAEVTISVGGTEVAAATTRGNGGFRATFPTSTLSPGANELRVDFAGSGRADATTFTTSISTGAAIQPPGNRPTTTAPPPAPGTPAPTTSEAPAPPPTATAAPTETASEPAATTPPPDPASGSTLTVTAPRGATNGDSVTITGTLVDGRGEPIPSVGISISDRTGEVPNSYAVTDDDGAFSSTYTVSPAEPDGQLTLDLSFDGAGTYDPASASVTVNITYVPVPTPREPPSATASPTGSQTAGATASPTATRTGGTTATVDEDGGSAWRIPLLILVILGGLAIIVAAALLLRGGFSGRQPTTDAGGLDFLEDELEPVEDGSFLGSLGAADEPTRPIDGLDETQEFNPLDGPTRAPDGPTTDTSGYEGDETQAYDAGLFSPDSPSRRRGTPD